MISFFEEADLSFHAALGISESSDTFTSLRALITYYEKRQSELVLLGYGEPVFTLQKM